jgi:hypothetical protein
MGGEDQYRQFIERKKANEKPKEAEFTTKHGSQGVTNPVFASYTQRYPDLQSNYDKNWKGKGVSLSEYGSMHYATHGKKEGRSLEAPKKSEPSRSSPSRATAPVAAAPAPAPTVSAPQVNLSTFDPTPVGIKTVEPLLSEVVMEGPQSEVVQNRVASMLDTNSPLFQQATGQAMRRLNARGITNSSMAQEEVMNSIMSVVIPIAQADAQIFSQQRLANQGFSNQFRQQQNEAFYQQMSQRLDGAIKETLAHIAGGYRLDEAKMNDLTRRYVADLQASTGMEVAGMEHSLGMESLRVKSAGDLIDIIGNPQAAQYYYDMMSGNGMSPTDFASTWGEAYQNPNLTTTS